MAHLARASVASMLRPLRWLAEEPVVYNAAGNELHRPDCPLSAGGVTLATGEALQLIWAPRVCQDCRPDVTTNLSHISDALV